MDFSLHEVITLARSWSAEGATIPCDKVLESLLPRSAAASGHGALSPAVRQQNSTGVRPFPLL